MRRQVYTSFVARRKAREATHAYLEGVALWYLERFPGSEARVRQVLRKRVARSVAELETDPQVGAENLEAVVAKLLRLGFIDDERFAHSRVRSLRSRGKSARAILATLRKQGISSELARVALETHDEGNTAADELEAARTFARRRRIGPHRRPGRTPTDEQDARREREKDLARMARAGFSFDVARRVIDASLED